MSHATELAIEVFFALYLLMVWVLTAGWMKARHKSQLAPAPGNENPFVSVVIAARNEMDTLPLLIYDLRKQQDCRFEVIIVDDASQDNTVAFATEAIDGDSRFTVISSRGAGKKEALSTGISAAGGSIILTTDADCRVGSQWISSMTEAFADPAIMLVFGAVRIKGSSFFDALQALEFATLVGSAASTAALGLPTMCNGACLSYRKSAFETVGGYAGNTNIPSGDDEFLMRKILATFHASVRYCNYPAAIVTTHPSKDIAAFLQQRIRWAGKWRFNDSLTSALLAVFVFLFHLTVVALPWLTLFQLIEPSIAITALLLKAVVEYVLVNRIRTDLDLPWNWWGFITLQLAYSYYVVIVALGAQFTPFEWKGRRLKSLIASASPLSGSRP